MLQWVFAYSTQLASPSSPEDAGWWGGATRPDQLQTVRPPQLTLKTSPVHLWTLSAAIRSSLDRDCRKMEDAWAYVLCVTFERVKRHTSPSHMYACTCACTYVHSHGRTHSCTCA